VLSHDLLERTALLDTLQAKLVQVRARGGAMVVIGGEAGAGKSALVRRFCIDAGPKLRILVGTCEALSTPRPLGPLHDMVPQLGRRTIDALTGADQGVVFDAFLTEIGSRASSVLMVIEDIHWADGATLDLMRFLVRRIGSTAALVLATYRNDQLGGGHPLRALLGDVATSPDVMRMTVPPLSAAAVTRLAGAEADAEELYRITGGNAFFVTELLSARSSALPTTVEDAVLGRAARLGADARAALDAAAAIGARVEPRLLLALGASVESVEQCLAAGLLHDDGDVLVFRHELVRTCLYGALSSVRRRELHRSLLDAYERTGVGDVVSLAHHAIEAADAAAVLRYAPVAAARAARLGAHAEAHALYLSAVQYQSSLGEVEAAELLQAYATECTVVDRLEESARVRAEVADRWRRLDRRHSWGVNLSLLAQAYLGLGRHHDAVATNARAISVLEGLGAAQELSRALWYDANLRMLDQESDAAIELGNRAVELSLAAGDHGMLANALMTTGAALMDADRTAEGRTMLDRSLAIGREHGLPNLVASVHSTLGMAALQHYRLSEAVAELTTAEAIAEECGHDNIRGEVVACLATTRLYQGDLDAAASLAHRVLGKPHLSAFARATALTALGRIRARRGDPDSSTSLDEALVIAQRLGLPRVVAPVRAARAEAAWLRGDRVLAGEEAAAGYQVALRRRYGTSVAELGYWTWLTGALDRLPTSARGPFALQVGGRPLEAADEWRRRGCPYEAAWATAEAGGERDLRAALSVFLDVSAAPAAALVRRRLRLLGARGLPRGPTRSTRGRPAKLTERESQVLWLMAKGLRNAEIAERHAVSPRTVGHQVSAILGKLEARSRTEAVERAGRLGLLTDRDERVDH
jgi:DNA-binding CsgD family transcriptional regulator/tetratricopeptide (TPR) repeat protein